VFGPHLGGEAMPPRGLCLQMLRQGHH
jgi:hypothetical protein